MFFHRKCVVLLGVFFYLVKIPAFAETDSECLQTKEGNPLKVIVREHAALFEKPDKASSSRPVRQFEVFYVLPPQKGSKDKVQNGFYRVATSPRLGAAVGWLPQEAAVEWSHQQVSGLRPKTDRDLVLFFATRQDAEKWFKGDSSVRPISREPANLVGTRLFPLLEVAPFKHNGEKLETYKLAYLHSGTKADPNSTTQITSYRPASETNGLENLQKDFILQVIFVMDTTGSMQPWIDAMKRVISQIVEELSQDPAVRDRIQFALVCYRDQLDNDKDQKTMEYVAKLECDLKAGKDHKEFLRRLLTVREATISSADYPEDVLAGLKMALDQAGWSKTASKHIVLIGDASAHTGLDSYKNVTQMTIPGILALAQPTGAVGNLEKIQIHGLRIVGHDPSDHAVCKEHFTQLTKGREYPGLHYQYEGPQDADRFVKELANKMRQLVQVTGQVASGQFQEVIQAAKKAAPGSDDSKLLGPIMELLQSAEGKSGAGASTFTEGWAVIVDRQGNKALEPHVFVTYGKLSLFSSALDFSIKALENAGDPGKRDVQKVVSNLQILATQVNLGENVSPDLPLDKLFSLVLGFPVRNPVFAKTPATLAAMSSADFDGWVRQVRASQSIVQSHINTPAIWFFLGDKLGRPQDRHAFIKVADMP